LGTDFLRKADLQSPSLVIAAWSRTEFLGRGHAYETGAG
jgi:hypothetical protein